MKLNRTFALLKLNRTLALPGIFCVVLALANSPAMAEKLVDFTIETDEAVYQVDEHLGLTTYVYNAGDEDLYILAGTYAPAAAIWVYENAAGLSRDDLLSEQEPISTRDVSVEDSFAPLHPGETLVGSGGGIGRLLDGPGRPDRPGPIHSTWGRGTVS